jgi:hypothetical protein
MGNGEEEGFGFSLGLEACVMFIEYVGGVICGSSLLGYAAASAQY